VRTPTRALLLAVCHRLELDPDQITRVSLLPDRVVVDHVDPDTGRTWTETEELPAWPVPGVGIR
jgi:hypothetical protein